MKNYIILTLSLILLVSCSQTIYLSTSQEKAQIIKDELLDKKIEMHLKDGSSRNNFIYNVMQDSITTIDYDRKSEITSINSIAFDELQSINIKEGDAGTAGFILGYVPLLLSLPISEFRPIALILPVPTGGIGWLLGKGINTSRIYKFDTQQFPQFNYGINLGVTYSHINTSPWNNKWMEPSRKIGNDLGLFFYYNISEKYAIQCNISYLHSGARWGDSYWAVFEPNYIDYDMSFINGSVRFKSNLFLSEISKKLMLCVGLYIEHNLKAKQDWHIEDQYYGHPDDLPRIPSDFRDEININTFGILYGLQLPFFYDEMRLNFMWYYSFTKLYKNDYPKYRADFTNKDDFHKQMLTFSFDYLFN